MHKKVAYYVQLMKRNRTNTNAFLIHISALAGLIFPFGQIITPLIAWQTFKERSPFLDAHGKEVVNFTISYTLYVCFLSIFIGGHTVGNFYKNRISWNGFEEMTFRLNLENVFSFLNIGILAGMVYLIGIALVIIAASKAKEGENYAYPFTLKFIK